MQFYPDTYFHLYNRTNNNELLFKNHKNYLYFLKQYRQRFSDIWDTLGYCLMPTHFHFLIRTKSESSGAHLQGGLHLSEILSKQIGIWLSSYTKAINRQENRHGSLFQCHSRAIPVTDEKYLLTLLAYIHQNPLRSNLVEKLEDWPFSSFPDYAGLRDGTLLNKQLIVPWFRTKDEFIIFSNAILKNIDPKVLI